MNTESTQNVSCDIEMVTDEDVKKENIVGSDVRLSEEKSEKVKFMFFDYPAVYFGIMMIFCSFIGWLSENIFRIFAVGIIDSRFMYLPFLGIYGLCVLALYGICGTPDKFRILNKRVFTEDSEKAIRYVFYCLVIAAAVMIGEISVGTFCEKLSGKILWNYTNIPLNLTKYTSIPTTVAITSAVFVLMKFIFTPLMELIEKKISYKAALIICLTLGVLIYLDTIWFMFRIIVWGDADFIWIVNLK